MNVMVKRIPDSEPDVQLTLSYDVAQTLLDVTYHVGGSPSGPRGHIDAVREAMIDAGVKRSRKLSTTGTVDVGDK